MVGTTQIGERGPEDKRPVRANVIQSLVGKVFKGRCYQWVESPEEIERGGIFG